LGNKSRIQHRTPFIPF